MQFLKNIFLPIIAIFKFINNYFKALIFLLILFLVFSPETDVKSSNLAQVDIRGAIFNADEVIKKLENIRNDKNIKGVLLYIDSPGGSLSPSVEIAMEVKKLKLEKKVVSYAAGSMTSGSYYAGVNADKIIANPGSFIGSIGVIMQAPNISELASKIGIKEQVVKAGEFKEAGTFTREWSEVERQSIQELVDKSYELFTTDVSLARNLKLENINEWANARVFLAGDAIKVGLIDELGGYFDAKKELENISNVDIPIWQETPKIEKIIQKITSDSVNSFISLIFSPKIK
ncbi:signal peptide peptidase protease IV [Campylobacter pinnipediorum subsp. caledonicus]|uniref:Signal peptide peptidase protease IV n=1 Tax=Campylobacter pinnipediorum subsp. caledonicus TaxID=1874362 RepID=A0A1S6U8E7_9BACT|nr:signal peptide peptidase SppA [Campylobacter pinnipediorum]AQW87983.1 signal peptide peptidase protease IV [Campylobacter pinnipediorum subsp. caledonicus]